MLGIQVEYDQGKRTLHIRQTQFIERIIERFGHESIYPTKNPNVVGHHLENEPDRKPADKKRFREIIGALLYVANGTRPDICVPLNALSQSVSAPTQAHMNAAIRVLRYLKGSSCVVVWSR